MNLRDIPPEQAARVLALALQACCLPPGVGAAVVAVAPVLVKALVELLDGDEADIELRVAQLPDDMRVVVEALARLEAAARARGVE